MPSTRQDFLRDRMLGGIDLTTPPHLLPEDKWRDAANFRVSDGRLVQAPGFVSVTPAPAQPLVEIVSLPSGRAPMIDASSKKPATCLFVGLHSYNTKVYSVRPGFTPSLLELLTTSGTAPPSTMSTIPNMWGWTTYAGQLWFLHPNLPLYYTDGTKIGTYTTDLPQGFILENFFDHLVTGNCYFRGGWEPYTVRWSDLYRPDVWTPQAGNEADFFEVTEWITSDTQGTGITTIKKLGDLLVIYTPDAIIGCRYVGLPKVMNFTPISTRRGTAFPNGVAVTATAHYFLDEKEMSFFSLSNGGIEEIGQPVKALLRTYDASSLFALRASLRSFVVQDRQEVWWCFPGVTGRLYQMLVYNWSSKSWSRFQFADVDITQTIVGGVRALSVDELAGQCDALSPLPTDWVDRLSDNNEYIYRLFVSSYYSNLLREAVATDASVSVIGLAASTSYLETGDRYFGTLAKVKEMDGVTIDAGYVSCDGIQVGLSVRERLGDAVTFQTVGVWNKDLKDNFLSFPKRVAGKIFRWRFTMLGSPARDVVWNSFTEHVYGAEAER